MKKEKINSSTVITNDSGDITEIAAPEDIQFEIRDRISIEFQSDVNGLPEHYIAVCMNHNSTKVIEEAIVYFKE